LLSFILSSSSGSLGLKILTVIGSFSLTNNFGGGLSALIVHFGIIKITILANMNITATSGAFLAKADFIGK
jgi:hypothetical protein